MPLVNRSGFQKHIFRENEEPATWLDADLWCDLNSTPRRLFINNDGTPLEV